MSCFDEGIFFTIIDPAMPAPQTEVRFNLNKIDDYNKISIADEEIYIDHQQMSELGLLLVAFADYDFDVDSVDALYDGFDLTPAERLRVAAKLRKVADAIEP